MREIAKTRTRTRINESGTDEPFQDVTLIGRSYNKGKTRFYPKKYILPLTRTSYEEEITHDTEVPNFKALQKAGCVIMNDYQNSRVTENFPIGSFVIRDTWEGWSVYSAYTACIDNLIPESMWPNISHGFNVDQLCNLAVTRLHASIDDAQVQALVSIAELHKTIATLRSTLFSVVKLIRTALRTRRLLLNGLISIADATQAYLQIRYGLRPLYYEVKGVIQAIEQWDDNARTRFTTSLGASSKSAKSISYQNSWGLATGSFSQGNRMIVTAGAIVEPRLNSNELLDKIRKDLGLDQFAESAWELIPFSFIVDWFWDVGSLIAAWTPELTVEVKGTWVTTDLFSRREVMCKTYRSSLYYGGYCGNVGVTGTSVTKTRTRYANPTIPQLPTFNIRLNVLKIADLLAIIASSVRSASFVDFIRRYKF